jgi:hypothetical protein
VPGDRHGSERTAVVAVLDRQDLVGTPHVGGHEQGGLVGLGAGVGEEHACVRDAGEPGDLLGQLDLLPDEVKRRRVRHAGADLPADGVTDLGHVVPDHGGQHAAEEVQVGAPGRVGDVPAAAGDDLQRVVAVVDRHPGRHHGAVAVEELAHQVLLRNLGVFSRLATDSTSASSS